VANLSLRRFRVWTPEVPDLYLSNLSVLASVCTARRLRVWTPEVPDFRQLAVKRRQKRISRGIFHESNLLPPRVTSRSTLSFHHGRSNSPSPSSRFSPSPASAPPPSTAVRRRRPCLQPPDVFWVRLASLSRTEGRRRGGARATVRSSMSVTAACQKLYRKEPALLVLIF
jgi:hypothetical protein